MSIARCSAQKKKKNEKEKKKLREHSKKRPTIEYVVFKSPQIFICLGSCNKRHKPQAPTPQAPIRNRQTRKVANAKGLHRNTNLT